MSPQRPGITRTTPNTITTTTLFVQTRGEGFTDITQHLKEFVAESRATGGMLLAFLRHTSASLVIQENADPDVQTDLLTALRRLAPPDGGWNHASEGADDMPAHIRTMLTAVSLHIPVTDGALTLGTWQGVYLLEHRARPHRREIVLQFSGHCAP